MIGVFVGYGIRNFSTQLTFTKHLIILVYVEELYLYSAVMVRYSCCSFFASPLIYLCASNRNKTQGHLSARGSLDVIEMQAWDFQTGLFVLWQQCHKFLDHSNWGPRRTFKARNDYYFAVYYLTYKIQCKAYLSKPETFKNIRAIFLIQNQPPKNFTKMQ